MVSLTANLELCISVSRKGVKKNFNMSVTRVPTYGGASDAGGQAGLNSLRTFWVNDTQESLERRFILQEDGEPYGTRWRNDGMPLHPEPTDDPLDPLNWTSVRKHTALAIVMWL